MEIEEFIPFIFPTEIMLISTISILYLSNSATEIFKNNNLYAVQISIHEFKDEEEK